MNEPPRDRAADPLVGPSPDPGAARPADAEATQRLAPSGAPGPPPAPPVAPAAPEPVITAGTEPVFDTGVPPAPDAEAPPSAAESSEAEALEPETGWAQTARPSPVRFLALLAGGLVVVLALGALISRLGSGRQDAAAAADNAVAAAPAVRVLLTVRDLPGELAITSDERVRGLQGIAAAEERRVARALTAGELPPVTDGAALAGGAAALAADAPLRPLAPVATRVADERPLLRWSPAAAPAAYVVTIADASGQVLATSPALADTEWRPSRALPRRRTLTWSVEARPRARGAVAERSAPARFAVLGAEELAWLEREIEAGGRSLLLTAVLQAEVGAFDDARVAIDELAAANPGSAEIARLRDRLHAATAPPRAP